MDDVNKNIIKKLKKTDLTQYENMSDLYEMARITKDRKLNDDIIWWSAAEARKGSENFYYLHKKSLLYAADYDFDKYLMYLEFDRPPEKRFYLPRRNVLKTVVDDLQDLDDGVIKFLSVSLPPRVGKALAFDTPVLTRRGWTSHGDLTIRDEVIAPNGSFVKVLAIHPVCDMEYEVSLTNGERIVCHGNHEWTVFNRHRQKTEILETNNMLKDFENNIDGRGHRYFYQLPNTNSLIGEEKFLPVEPYTLGAWLGDGTNRNPTISNAKTDYAIIQAIIDNGSEVSWTSTHAVTGVGYYGVKDLRVGLQEMGMCHSRRSAPKHVPDIYLTSSIPQRLELLAGLLDTDGCLREKERRYDFVTSDIPLRDSVVSLISTFGWRCSVVEYKPTTSSSGITGKRSHWVISFNPTFHIPCRLERKKLFTFSKQRRIAINSIHPIHGKQGNCISVEGGEYLVGEQLIPTHNSTLGCFFMSWIMGKYPDEANIMSGHSDKLTDGFYREVQSILLDPQYLWNDVFPRNQVARVSAKDESIDINEARRYPTLTCRSIGGTLTGAVEAERCLYCDDLIEDLEEALNPIRLANKYDAYANQLKDRKKDGAYELMIGTRWSVADIQGRIEEQYRDDPEYRFRVISALDDNGQSQFDYPYGVGFSTAYYIDMKASIDDASWCSKYLGQPYVREGLLFPIDELNYYNGSLPDGEPDRMIAVCDVAWGGGDSLSMPFADVYGGAVYIKDVIHNKGDKTVTRPIVIGKIKLHKPHMTRFEANNGGDEYCDAVDKQLREDGYKLNLSHRKAPSNMSKMSRIIQAAPDIKQFYFIDDKHSSTEYKAFMRELTTFVVTGKNKNDDAPDSLAMLSDFLTYGRGSVEIIKRPF